MLFFAKTNKPAKYHKRYWTSAMIFSIKGWFDSDVNVRLQLFYIFTTRFLNH